MADNNKQNCDKVISDEQVNMKKDVPVPVSRTKITDFTIDHILTKAGTTTKKEIPTRQINNCQMIAKSSTNYPNDLTSFKWLKCTRYHPPKLMRPSRSAPIRRSPGRLPRIPFSPLQLRTLEQAFSETPYLSSHQAATIATILQLTDTRVKIWFQNRRARARREPANNLVTSTTQSSPGSSETSSYLKIIHQSPDRTNRKYDQ